MLELLLSCFSPVPSLQRIRVRVPCRAPMGAEERWLPWLFLALAPATCPHLLLASGSLLGESCGTQTRNARKQPWEAVGSVSRSGSASRLPRPAARVLSPVLVPQSRWVLGFSFPETQKRLLPLGNSPGAERGARAPPGCPQSCPTAPALLPLLHPIALLRMETHPRVQFSFQITPRGP